MLNPVTLAFPLPNTLVGAFINPTIRRLIEDRRERRQLEKELADRVDCFLAKLETINDYLQDAEQKQRQNRAIRRWLQRLQQTVYDAEDILDEYATDLAIKETKFYRKMKVSQIDFLKPDPNRPAKTSQLQVAKDIESINRKLDDLLKERERLELNIRPKSSTLAMGSRESSSYFNTFEDISLKTREVIKNEIVEILLQDLNKDGANQPTLPTNNNEGTHTRIIPITGMGGIGKTTLAKKIFDDDKVQSYFNTMRVWVCVSYNFEAKNLIKSIIESIDGRRLKTQSLKILQVELRKLIEGKKLLLVLDDVWTIKNDDWPQFISPLQHAKKLYCCILITTRDSYIRTAVNEDSLKTFPLDELEFDESWELFHKIAFRNLKPKECCYKQLEEIGKKVVTKLKGSPLAIKTVGSLLGDELDDDDLWLRVSKSELPEIESELSELTEGESNIYPILMLSYQHLPSEVKDCLFIFSLFPKGYVFTEDNIILLWLAYGIIGGEKGKHEAQGRKYFQRLVDRSFLDVQRNRFQNSKYSMSDSMDGSFVDNSGNIFSIHDSTMVRPLSVVHGNENQDKMCSMHDLIYDVVQSIFRPDFHFSSEDKEHGYILKNLHHTSIYHVGKKTVLRMDDDTRDSKELAPYMLGDLKKKGDYEKARTLLLTGNILIDGKCFESLVAKMTHLRVLRLVGLTIEKIPDSIGKLKLLRYLVVKTSDTKLPESIGYLHNLQVLGIFESGIKYFPINFTRLVNLRYILGDVENHCVNIKGIGNLRMLRMLPRFRIMEKTGFDISELENLNELHGKLCIESLGLVQGKEAAERARLEGKKYLKKLCYSWGTDTVHRSSKVDEEVFRALKPCECIEEIVVDGYQGTNLPIWMDSELRKLDVLMLKGCNGLSDLPLNIGKMKLLRCLHLCQLSNLGDIRWEMCPSVLFPALEKLKLEDLPELENCIVSGQDVEKRNPKLVSLSIRDCPKLKHVALWMLISFDRVQGCHILNNSHVSSKRVSIEIGNCWYLPLPPSDLDLHCLVIQGKEDTVDIRFGRGRGDCPWNISVPDVVAVKPLYEEKSEGSGFCSSDSCSIIVGSCEDNAGYATASAASQAVDGAAEVHPRDTIQEMRQRQRQHPFLYFCNGLTSLTEVFINGCTRLASCTLPTTMASLRELVIDGCRVMGSLELPETITYLRKLEVWRCPSLQTCRLPPIPADLDRLEVDMVGIHFGRGRGDCPWNISVPGVLAVKPLYEEKPEGSGFCSSDACSIIVSNCEENEAGYATASAASQAVDRSFYFCDGLASLKKIFINGCARLASCTLPTTMASLQELVIDGCKEMASLDLPETMTCLRKLVVSSCPSLKTCRLPQVPADFKRSVRFSSGDSVWHIDSSNPELLFHVACHSCPTGIKTDELVSHVTTTLDPVGCSLQQVAQLIMETGAGHLKSLSITHCPDLEFVHGNKELEPILLCFPYLTSLSLLSCRQLKSLPPDVTSRLVYLREIRFVDLPLQSTLDLRHLERLKEFTLSECDEVTTLRLPPVIFERVWLSINRALTSVWLPPATASLDISMCPLLVINLGDPSSGEVAVPATDEGKADGLSLLQVTHFNISCRHQQQLAQLLERIAPAHLKGLYRFECEDLKEMSTLRKFTSLTALRMQNCPQLESWPDYICSQRFPLLKYIQLIRCPLLSSLPDMQYLSSLQHLHINACPKLNDWYERQRKGNESRIHFRLQSY